MPNKGYKRTTVKKFSEIRETTDSQLNKIGKTANDMKEKFSKEIEILNKEPPKSWK